MPRLSIDSSLHLQPSTPLVHLQRAADTEDLRDGDVVESWDYVFRWDGDCVKASVLEEWRRIPDPLVDDYLATLPASVLAPSHDQLGLLLDLAEAEPSLSGGNAELRSEERCRTARALLEHLTRAPPEGVRATSQEIQDAQECFYRYAGGLLLGTFYVSLVGGFSSPRITSVLHQTSYLVAPTVRPPQTEADRLAQVERIAYAPITDAVRKRTSVRLLETLQFVLDIMGSPLPPGVRAEQRGKKAESDKDGAAPSDNAHRDGPACLEPLHGEGWKSAVRVRLLHGVVRRRVMKTVEASADGHGPEEGAPEPKAKRKPPYDFAADGYPLNAEDMTATLASFCVAPLWALSRINSPAPGHLRRAYIAHWRHVGYYLGVPEDILAQHFDVSGEYGEGRASKIFASLLTHLFIHEEDLATAGEGALPPPTLPLLHTAAGMPPFKTPLKHHFRAARFFLGDALSDALTIPPTPPVQAVLLRFYLAAVVYPEWFGLLYPRRGWERSRQRLTQDLLGRLVRFSLDGRRSAFRPHTLVGTEGRSAKQEGELPDDIADAERVSGLLDPAGGKKAVREWRVLMLEMLGVSAGVVAVGVYGVWRMARVVGGLYGQ